MTMSIGGGGERRQFGRRQVLLHGWVYVPGRPPLACTVRDISVGGALLEFETQPWLSFRFKLEIPSSRFVTFCEVRHQYKTRTGVQFVAPEDVADLSPPGRRRIDSDGPVRGWTKA